MTPFDSPEGTVWEYTDVRRKYDILVVYGKSQHGFRPYFNLVSGEIGSLYKDSLYNRYSTIFAETT